MFPKATAECPVCGTTLGYLTKNEVCSFLCQECRWIFSWTGKGNMGKPVKIDGKLPDKCDCLACEARDEEKYFRKSQ